MGMYESRGQIGKAMKDLQAKWADVKMTWDDSNSAFFEKTHIEAWEADARNAVGAMDHASQVLSQIRRDCSQ